MSTSPTANNSASASAATSSATAGHVSAPSPVSTRLTISPMMSGPSSPTAAAATSTTVATIARVRWGARRSLTTAQHSRPVATGERTHATASR